MKILVTDGKLTLEAETKPELFYLGELYGEHQEEYGLSFSSDFKVVFELKRKKEQTIKSETVGGYVCPCCRRTVNKLHSNEKRGAEAVCKTCFDYDMARDPRGGWQQLGAYEDLSR